MFRVLQKIELETLKGIIPLSTGQVIKLSEDDALPLYDATVIRPVGYKLHSERLKADLWIVHTSQDMELLRAQGFTDAIYTAHDIQELKKIPKEALKIIHEVKVVFPMATIEEIAN